MIGRQEIIYDENRWRIFRQMRAKAAEMICPLKVHHINAYAYGSIARGDVSEGSDIDIFIPRPPSPTLIEVILERSDVPINIREIIQATPSYVPKGYIYIEEKLSYSFPLTDLRNVEQEFYGFAGSVDASQIKKGVRVPGVNKSLLLIEPTKQGHLVSPVLMNEGVVAKRLGVSVSVVLDRVRTLRRREKIGRTGVYLKRSLAPEETFEKVFRQLSQRRPAIRRRLRM